MRTLVVEDDHCASEIIQKLLEQYGPVDVAENGQAAVESFEQSLIQGEKYDLICLDIMMPKMDGFEALVEIRQQEEDYGVRGDACTRIIVTTALSRPQDIFNAYHLGCESYIIKPLRRENLLGEIEKLGLLKQKV